MYVSGFGAKPDARADAAYFVRWLDRVIEATEKRHADFNTETEFQSTLEYLRQARGKYLELGK